MDYLNKKPEELKRYVSSLDQIAGIRLAVLTEGKGKGVAIADINNGSGLNYTVIIDRGMDIGETRFKGIPIAWISPNGICRADLYEPESIGWLRTWPGGLLTGCGMRNVGVPSEYKGECFGLHGRLSHIPAENVHYSKGFDNEDRYVISISGTMRESRMFGENIKLIRTIASVMGEDEIEIKDIIENEGASPSELMLLYHINIGYPMLSEYSYLEAPEHKIIARDEREEKGINEWNTYTSPQDNFDEQVFFHDIPADQFGISSITLVNPHLGLKLSVSYRKAELPNLIQWKQVGTREYVTGLEPANCFVGGIAAEKNAGTIKILQPGERIETLVKVKIEAV